MNLINFWFLYIIFCFKFLIYIWKKKWRHWNKWYKKRNKKEIFTWLWRKIKKKLNNLYKIDTDNNYIISPKLGFVYLEGIVEEIIPQTIIIDIKTTIYDNEINNHINESNKIKTQLNEFKVHYLANKSNIKYEIIEEY